MTPSAPASVVSPLETLRQDHRDCQAMVETLRDRLDAISRSEAGAMDVALAAVSQDAQRLSEMLRLHYLREEQGLFPLLNQYRTMVLLEVEHDDLLQLEQALLAAIEDSVAQNAPSRELLPAFEEFCDRLRAHVREEESGVFTLAESAMEPEELALAARKCRELAQEMEAGAPWALDRPQPQMTFHRDSFFAPGERPIIYATTFQEEQASVQRLWLEAGSALTRHWSAQYQYLLLLSGAATLKTDAESVALTPGQGATVTPRFAFSLSAEQDSHFLVTKVWPRPHFRRAKR